MNPAAEEPIPERPEPANAVVVRVPPAPPEVRRKRFGARQLAMIAAFAAIGGMAGYLGAKFGTHLLPPLPGPRWLKLVPILWLLPAWALVVGWHELGHLVGGWLTGGRFLLWIVGPLKVQRTPAGVRVGWNRSLNLAGGLAACLPLDPAKMTPARAATMILGGPVFSVVLALAGFALAKGLDGQAPPLALHAVLNVAGFSALVAVLTLVPATAGGFKSDGKRVLDLLRGDRRSDQEAAMLTISTALLAGHRPGDLDPALVARATALNDGSLFDLYAHITVFPHVAERGDWPAAQAHLDRVLAAEEKLAPALRSIVRCEYAWLLATRTGAAAEARAWLDSASRQDFDPVTRLRAEAAVLLAEGRHAEAAAKAREGLHALEHKSLSPTKNPFAEDALYDVLERASAGGAAS